MTPHLHRPIPSEGPRRKPRPSCALVLRRASSRGDQYCGVNGVFLSSLETDGPLVRARNVREPAGIEPRRSSSGSQRGAVRPTAARTFNDDGVPITRLLFFHDAEHVAVRCPTQWPAKVSAVCTRSRKTLRSFILRARKQFRGFDPSGENWLGLYSVNAPFARRTQGRVP